MPYYRCAGCGLTSYGASTHSTVSVCPSCSAPLAGATRLDVSSASGHNTVLESRPEAAAEARRAVNSLALPRETRESLLLLVSELVTNAVVHAGPGDGRAISLSITVSARRVRAEVHDHGPGFDVPASDVPHPLLVGGQGLVIVDGLSDAWGVDRSGDGCTVWCEVVIEQRAVDVERSVTRAYVRELAADLVRGAPGGRA